VSPVRSFRTTIRCCYVGMFVQAILINLAPVLFIPLRDQFGLTFEQIGRLVLANFATQVVFDLVCGPLVDRLGPRRFAVAAHALACVGLWLFAGLPWVLPNPYHGLLAGTIVLSMGAGILELVLSPIINAVPSDRKAGDMSLLHSFYAWGLVAVVLATALAVWLAGARFWPWYAVFWSLFPLANAIAFARAPMPALVTGGPRQRLRELVRHPIYLVAVLAIGLAGATEVTMSQWVSAFAEKGLGLAKVVADVLGLCLFGVGLGVGRVWFGKLGGRVALTRYLIAGSGLSAVAYAVAALAPWPVVSLAACVLCGLAVSLLWPGVLSLAADCFPQAGASMFAMLSASGDFGAALAPWLVGVLADRALRSDWLPSLPAATATAEQAGLRQGLLAGTVVPLAGVVALLVLARWKRRHDRATSR
jgi:fucose permease